MNSLRPRQVNLLLLWMLGVFAVAACSCQPFYMPALFHSAPAPLAQEKPPTPTVTATPHAIASETAAAVGLPEEGEEASRPAAASTPSKAETKPPQIAVVGSPAEEESARQRAQRTVDQALKRLAQMDRSKLSKQDVRDYDLVAGFARDAQRAIQEQDFLKAEGLARKASVLATQLATRLSQPP